MSECPVCQTQYIPGNVNCCSVCGWDLTPYPPALVQSVPSEFLQQQSVQLDWARQMWAKWSFSQGVWQTLSPLKEQLSQIQQQLKHQLLN